MTVLVGILCSDGVVIGTDSAAASSPVPGQIVMEHQDLGALKIELIASDAITAITGSVGLAQRFDHQVRAVFEALKQPFQPPQIVPQVGIIGSPIQQVLFNLVPPNQIPLNVLDPVAIGRIVPQIIISDFKTTQSALQGLPNHGWGLGALLAFVKNDTPHLIEFDQVQFHPELKGMPDPARGDRVYRAVSMGITQPMSDPFLAHAYRVLFGETTPTIERAKLVVAWTVDHASRYNPGGVGGDLQLAVLEKIKGTWTAHHADTGEVEQQVQALEQHITEFSHRQRPDIAAGAAIDVHGALEGD
jgi:hypothetical protein